MIRSLEENDYPHRFDVAAVNLIYETHDLEEMSFYEFAFTSIVYNRFKRYSKVMQDVRTFDNKNIRQEYIDMDT